jgi:hypothetical protein
MREWSIGVMEWWGDEIGNPPTLHYSNRLTKTDRDNPFEDENQREDKRIFELERAKGIEPSCYAGNRDSQKTRLFSNIHDI